MSKQWGDEKAWAAICLVIFMAWVSMAHSWAVDSIFPEYEKPNLVDDYALTYDNWRQHLIDMGENRIKEQYASDIFELKKSIANRSFYRSGGYWVWFAPLVLLGGGLIFLVKNKGERYWKINTVKLSAKYAVLIWLATSMWSDPLRLHTPLLATIMFLVLVFNGSGVDPISTKIKKRKENLSELTELAGTYNKIAIWVAVAIAIGFQLKLAYSYYWPYLSNDGYSGWWVSDNLWSQISDHVLWFARALLAIIVSFTTAGYHYFSYEVARLVKSTKEEIDEVGD